MCEITSNTGVNQSHHQPRHEDPCIPQLDGVDDLLPMMTDPTLLPGLPVNNQATQPWQQGVRQASYNLQKKRQLSNLSEDSTISDFEINISPVAHNVTIKCNTGFYNLVVLPALSNITEHFEQQVDGVTINCNEVTKHVDKSNSHINVKIVFPLTYHGGTSAGAVTVHLHHTTRRVQCQGSSLVHGVTRAPVWFVDNFVKVIFNFYANSKSLDISKFNAAVRECISRVQSRNVSNSGCKACNMQFDGRASPVECNECNHKYHRKCLQSRLHVCKTTQHKAASAIITTVPPIFTTPPIPATLTPRNSVSSAVTTTTSTATTAVTTTIVAATTTASVSLASDGSINSIIPNRTTEQVFTIIESDNPPHHPVQPKNSEAEKHDANTDLAVHQPVIQPLPSLSQTSSNSSQQKTKTKPKQNKSQNVPAIDKSNFEIECQRKQLVAAQAKIQELEVEMTKLKKTNFILGERIKMFEKKPGQRST